ncbi:MAG: 50S ribosomal protein bL37 [Planctomycetota bacterium]
MAKNNRKIKKANHGRRPTGGRQRRHRKAYKVRT